METTPYQIAVVDDHPVMREGLAAILRPHPEYKVVLLAGHGAEYEAALPQCAPIHLAVVNLRMPVRDGYETIAGIRAQQLTTLVAAIAAEPCADEVHRALQAGAHTVLCKSYTCAELLQAVAQLLATGYHHNALMQAQLLHRPAPGSPQALRAKVEALLCKREMQFLLLYIHPANHSGAQMATRMKVKESTIEHYRKQVAEKTGARTRFDMLHFARRFGLG